MTTPQGGQPLDLNSIRINGAYDNLGNIVKEMAAKAANYAGEIARVLAEKAMLEEEIARLKADNERLTKAAGEAKAAPEKAKA
ncbi:hypothetical protein [Stappia sp. WLB 29]|uniref:hypothetical protein n=1 Tax=Stappia sp. WLB 29 TaxID=2925220 RepID=UPI0020C09F72|nr:hypothetical protein [Stappia sp. WLB 29]